MLATPHTSYVQTASSSTLSPACPCRKEQLDAEREEKLRKQEEARRRKEEAAAAASAAAAATAARQVPRPAGDAAKAAAAPARASGSTAAPAAENRPLNGAQPAGLAPSLAEAKQRLQRIQEAAIAAAQGSSAGGSSKPALDLKPLALGAKPFGGRQFPQPAAVAQQPAVAAAGDAGRVSREPSAGPHTYEISPYK